MHIDETLTAKGYTRAADVPAVFGRPRTIDGIVIHHWGVPGQTHNGVVNFFTNGPGTTSAHFVASSDGVHCLVSPLDAAWHSGNAVGNATTIGIECRPEGGEADYRVVAELIAWLRAEYGDLPLTPHRQWQATACPGIWNLGKLDALARNLTPPATPPAPKGMFMSNLTPAEQREALTILRELRPLARDLRQGIPGIQGDGDTFSFLRQLGIKLGVHVDDNGRKARLGKK